MKIAITGGTGFLGSVLTELLLEKDHEVFILTRSDKPKEQGITYVRWLSDGAYPEAQLKGIDALVNLAGTSINDGLWTDKQKKKIYDSRVSATKEVLRILSALEQKPEVLVNASAVGIYPASEHKTYTEADREYGNDFLAETVLAWEGLAEQAQIDGVRTAYARLGILFGKEQGALPLMALPYKLYAGGTVGTGRQWLSWIHVRDAARAILFAIEQKELTGPFNVTAPNPQRMKTVGKEIGRALGRPHWIPAPSFALKAALGDKSRLVLEGQRALPTVLLDHGFKFEFPNLPEALADLYK